MKILVSDSLSPSGIGILKQAGFDVDVKTGLSEDQLVACIGAYDALLVRSGTKATAKVINAGENLKVIGRAGVGVDNVDVPAASRQGIVVMNTPGGNTITTAEHALSLLTSLARNIAAADASVRQGRWERKLYEGVELAGKTLGIIGLGRIGREIALRVQAMGMQVVAYDPLLTRDEAQRMGVKLLSLDELYPAADFITVHTPINDQTRHLINKDTIAKMKTGVRIVNCARGGIINEPDLAEAIKSGKVAGAALDVFEQEPPTADNPLTKMEQVVCTPHLGASTTEAQDKVAFDVAEQVAAFFQKGVVINAVNAPQLAAEVQSVLAPYLDLAQNLGRLLGQLIGEGGKVLKVQAGLNGEQLQQHAKVINTYLLAGLMGGLYSHNRVNVINAKLLADEKQIELKPPQKQSDEDYSNLIHLQAETDKGTRTAAATLLGGKFPRIVMLDDFRVEFEPTGCVLILFNQDMPGIIGNIGTALGQEHINIANMQFGRRVSGGEAISIFRVDSHIPDNLLPQFANLPHINSVQQVCL
ncbi:MAG: phosphoglycerate dehydrogenase [Candidatus Schekmanbacteria bacterium]|nr:phosphoglycerate dehydrogenase [Candidatus Schekmanbacteria bacterium]